MKGDFSTDRFNPAKHYNRVLKQQGRVDLDSDWNEQAAITQHLIRTIVVDLLGRAGGPVDNCGFGLLDAKEAGFEPAVGDFLLGAGRYYVDGLLVENEEPVFYSQQPEPSPVKLNAGTLYLAYLDVFERHVTWIEDDTIREVALGGPDTTTRVKTVWQVRVLEAGAGAPPTDAGTAEERLKKAREGLEAAKKNLEQEEGRAEQAKLRRAIARLERQVATLEAEIRGGGVNPPPAAAEINCQTLLQPLRDWTSGTMAARVEPAEPSDTPCVLPPESRYRGLENHLYRIEIHASGDTADADQVPTFKWSRENGSVATRWLGTTGSDVRVGNTQGFAAGQIVEFTTDADDIAGRGGPLTRITRVGGDTLTVEAAPAWRQDSGNPKVRRWDQTANDERTLIDGAIAIVPGADEEGWIEIEDGIEVRFSVGTYRSGDYWLIPARVITGAIQWPVSAGGAARSLPPRGVRHHYAPLFVVEATGQSPFVILREDCRCRFAPLPCIEEARA